MKQTKFTGKLWVITSEDGKLIDDIDTDMIYHNAHLAVTQIEQMGRYAFGNLQGWEDFAQKVQPGSILICGKNFGAGSSRQHAVDCFKALGVSALIAESFGAIYKRNAVNAGFPILACPGLSEKINGIPGLQTGAEATLDLGTGVLRDPDGNIILKTTPFTTVQMDIYQAGNIFEYGRSLDGAPRGEVSE